LLANWNWAFISFEPGHFAGKEKVMRSGNRKIVLVLSGLVLATVVAPFAHAGCGLYSPVRHTTSWQPRMAMPRLVSAAFILNRDGDERSEPSMVGTWKEHWIAEGNKEIPDGTEIDANYAQWHSDGTEMQVSGMRAPLTGDVCLGEWIRTGARTYQLNHFGVSYDSTGQNIVGPARIQQWITIDAKGNSTSGTFTIDQYDLTGGVLQHVQGKVIGTRVTMETGFQPVE
jgi:hypothetical protein